MTTYHLAQLNIGRIREPLDSPQLAGFVNALEAINALADAAPGFVWRLQTEDGDATAIRPYDDDMLLVNMSVWESLEALAAFVYRSDHRAVMVQRRQWFERMDEAFLVLWWVPAGHLPTVAEAIDRLDLLRTDGPTPMAFTFRSPFPPPGTDVADAEAAVEADDRWGCPTG
jgi:heme-degrading monooxygenase HmoA